jgi:regulator of nucleoside diphosphate kinase
MTGTLPPIFIARRDHARLERLAAVALRERHPVSRFLISEIQRAVVCDTHEMSGSVARLNGWVTYRVDGSKHAESKILVCPEEFRSEQINLSVLSPLGAAVLGMRVGDRMKFFSIEGGLHFVIVESLNAPAGAPLLFPFNERRGVRQVRIGPRGPDDEGPTAA